MTRRFADLPRGAVISVGHPANAIYVVCGEDGWRYVDSGRLFDPEDLRASWRVISLPGSDKERLAAAWDEGYYRGVRDAEGDLAPADNPYRGTPIGEAP